MSSVQVVAEASQGASAAAVMGKGMLLTTTDSEMPVRTI